MFSKMFFFFHTKCLFSSEAAAKVVPLQKMIFSDQQTHLSFISLCVSVCSEIKKQNKTKQGAGGSVFIFTNDFQVVRLSQHHSENKSHIPKPHHKSKPLCIIEISVLFFFFFAVRAMMLSWTEMWPSKS